MENKLKYEILPNYILSYIYKNLEIIKIDLNTNAGSVNTLEKERLLGQIHAYNKIAEAVNNYVEDNGISDKFHDDFFGT